MVLLLIWLYCYWFGLGLVVCLLVWLYGYWFGYMVTGFGYMVIGLVI